MRDLNALAARVHEANHKWWVSLDTGEPIKRNRYELLMLMQSEVAEAMEGERKGLQDDKLPDRPMAEVEIADVLIRALDYAGGFGIDGLYDAREELSWGDLRSWTQFTSESNRGEVLFALNRLIGRVADEWEGPPRRRISRVIAGCEMYCQIFGYDLWGAFEAKMSFNYVREDHTIEARKAAGGKKW